MVAGITQTKPVQLDPEQAENLIYDLVALQVQIENLAQQSRPNNSDLQSVLGRMKLITEVYA